MDYEDDKYDEKYAALRNPNRRLRPGDGLHPPKLETPPPVPVDPFTSAPAASEAPPPVPGAPVAPGARLIEPTWRTEGLRAQDPRPPKVYLPEDYRPYEVRTARDGSRSAAIDGGGYAYTHGAPLPEPPKPHDFLEGMGETDIGNAVKRAASFQRSFTQTNPNDTMFERVYGTEAALRRQATGRGQNPTMAQAAALRGNTGAAEIANAQREAVYGEGGYREQYLRGRAYDTGLSPAEREAARQELADLMEIRRINLSDRMNERDADAYARAAEAGSAWRLPAALAASGMRPTFGEDGEISGWTPPPPAPVAFGGGAGAIPDGAGGYVYREPVDSASVRAEGQKAAAEVAAEGRKAAAEAAAKSRTDTAEIYAGAQKATAETAAKSREAAAETAARARVEAAQAAHPAPDARREKLARLYADRQAALRGGLYTTQAQEQLRQIDAQIAALEGAAAPAQPAPAPAQPAPSAPQRKPAPKGYHYNAQGELELD